LQNVSIAQVKEATLDCIKKAETVLGVKMPNVKITFDLKGRCAGMAGMARRTPSGFEIGFFIRYNAKFIEVGGKTAEHLLLDTVPHEVAHIVCMANPKLGNGHNAGWKRVCLALGGNGQRCYSENDAPEAVAINNPFVYTTDLGFEVKVSKIMHRRIQQEGGAYIFKNKGRVTKACQYKVIC
jgi:predicted SprT family Zn-dependent metalloprotease